MLDVLFGEIVEGGGGLIEQQDFRLVGEGTGDGDALGLAAGKGRDIVVFVAGHADLPDQIDHLRVLQEDSMLRGTVADIGDDGAGK